MGAIDDMYDLLCSSESTSSTNITLEGLQSCADQFGTRIHLAIMTEPYLTKVRTGEKFIESRLTKVNISPFEQAGEGDVILFKRSGGAILAIASVERAEFRHLAGADAPKTLAEKYADGLSYEPGYVETKREAKFASLLWLSEVRSVPPTPLDKRGRQAWVTFHPTRNNLPPATSDGVLF